jgi:hypothetical protein
MIIILRMNHVAIVYLPMIRPYNRSKKNIINDFSPLAELCVVVHEKKFLSSLILKFTLQQPLDDNISFYPTTPPPSSKTSSLFD